MCRHSGRQASYTVIDDEQEVLIPAAKLWRVIVKLLVPTAASVPVKFALLHSTGAWEDISLRSDQGLALYTGSFCYRLRLTEQQTRAIEWG